MWVLPSFDWILCLWLEHFLSWWQVYCHSLLVTALLPFSLGDRFTAILSWWHVYCHSLLMPCLLPFSPAAASNRLKNILLFRQWSKQPWQQVLSNSCHVKTKTKKKSKTKSCCNCNLGNFAHVRMAQLASNNVKHQYHIYNHRSGKHQTRITQDTQLQHKLNTDLRQAFTSVVNRCTDTRTSKQNFQLFWKDLVLQILTVSTVISDHW